MATSLLLPIARTLLDVPGLALDRAARAAAAAAGEVGMNPKYTYDDASVHTGVPGVIEVIDPGLQQASDETVTLRVFVYAPAVDLQVTALDVRLRAVAGVVRGGAA